MCCGFPIPTSTFCDPLAPLDLLPPLPLHSYRPLTAYTCAAPYVVDIGELEAGALTSFTYTVTNYGLIRADNVRMQLPSNHPFLRFEWTDPITVEANTTILVPVRVTGAGSQATRRRRSNGCYPGLAGAWVFVMSGLRGCSL